LETGKFVVAQVAALGWLGLSVLLSLPWVRELAATITLVPAILVVGFVAYLPGWLVTFLAISLLLDRQPPLRRSHPTIPVTVLVAARNEADRIQETISYIARQDYPGPIEVLVADNGSRDGTRAPAEAYGAATGQRVRCIEESRPGKSHALNTGLAAVRTELVITLDADTLLHPRAVRQLVARLLNAPPDVQAVAGSVLVRNSRDSLWTRMQEWDYFLGIASVKRMQGLYQGTLVAQGAFSLYRTQAMLQAGWLARRHRRGHRPDLATHAARGPGLLRALRGRLHRRPDPPCPPRPPAGPLGAGHDRGHPQREAMEPATLAAAVPHRHRPAHPCPGRRLRPGVASRPRPGGDRSLLDRRALHPGRAAAHPVVNAILYRFQRRRVFNLLGLRVRRNTLGFLGFVLAYQMLMSPIAVVGYGQELLGLRRRWK
jgi:poly-beta-1,6-N-acetyl-D-glucosamine synthase